MDIDVDVNVETQSIEGSAEQSIDQSISIDLVCHKNKAKKISGHHPSRCTEKIGGVNLNFPGETHQGNHSNLIFAVLFALYFGKLHKGTPHYTRRGLIFHSAGLFFIQQGYFSQKTKKEKRGTPHYTRKGFVFSVYRTWRGSVS